MMRKISTRKKLSPCLLVLLIALTTVSARAQEKAKRADQAVDIVGINTHLYYPGVYTDGYASIIKPRLQELGVRHLRDGNPVGNATFDARVKELASLGMKFILICDTRFGLATSITQSKDHVKSLNADPAKPVLMVEGANEFDCPNQQGFGPELRQQTIDLWNAFKNDGATAGIPVAGPSFCNTASSPGVFQSAFSDATNYLQYGNMHPYPGGLPVEGAGGGGWGITLDEAINRYKLVSGSDPIIITESGHKMSGDVEGNFSITQRAAAKYIPRMLLTYLNKGITRTYLYQLINDDDRENFGMLNNDGTPRLQFTALKNYINLLKDPGTAYTTGSLTYSLSGDLSNIQRTLLQKRDGRFYLILWQGVKSADPGLVNLEPAARSLTLNLTTKISSAKIYTPSFSTSQVGSTLTNPTSINLSVPDHIVVVELTPAPQTSNLVANAGFEASGSTQTPANWSTWPGNSSTHANADYTETGGHNSTHRGTHYKQTEYEVYTYQTKTGLTNGTYTLTAWVEGGSGQTTAFMSAKDYGGSELKAGIPQSGHNNWSKISIPGINVTNGQCTFGFYSKAAGGKWLSFDNVELVRVSSASRMGSTEPEKEKSFTLTPNPATDLVTISLAANKPTLIQISDLRGRTFLSQRAAGELKVKVTDWPSGLYIIRQYEGGPAKTKKLLIQH